MSSIIKSTFSRHTFDNVFGLSFTKEKCIRNLKLKKIDFYVVKTVDIIDFTRESFYNYF